MYKQPCPPRLRRIRSAAAKRRWRTWTPEDRSAYCSEMARAGWEDRTPEERKERGRKLAEGRRRAQEARLIMANLTQELYDCKLVYDLTQHSLSVFADDGKLALKLWSLPDTPGGFDIRIEDHAIEVHNPNGVDFVPMPDSYEDNKAAGLE